MRAKSKAQLTALVERFNQEFPVGTRVMLRKDTGEVETSVKYEAAILGDHSAVAWFEGVSGGYSIADGRVRRLPVTTA